MWTAQVELGVLERADGGGVAAYTAVSEGDAEDYSLSEAEPGGARGSVSSSVRGP